MSFTGLNSPEVDGLAAADNSQQEVSCEGNIQDVVSHYKRHTADACCKSCRVPLRYTVAVAGFVGFFCAFASRGCINVAIVVMVNSTDSDDTQLYNSSVDRCPAHDELNVTVRPSLQTQAFDWSAETRSLILGSFYYGYAISQLPGGLLSTYWQPQHVFGLTISLSGLLCALMPLLTQYSVNLLITARFLMGFIQGPIYPNSLAVAGQWSPAFERSTILVLIVSGSTLGEILSPIITGLLCDSPLLGGWPSAFYLFGVLSCVWYLMWLLIARHNMSQHPWIADNEKQYILQSSHCDSTPPLSCPPWKLIFTSLAVYALLLQALLDGAGFYIIYTCYPTYMKTVLNYDITQDSLLTAAPPLAAFITGLAAGPAADFIITHQWLSVTTTRKLFTFVGGMSMAVFIAAVGYVDCDHILAVTFLTISWAFSGLIGVGPHISALDMSPQHAGVLNGIVNSVNSVGGFISPVFVELLTRGQASRSRWQLVFFITASLHASGNLAYVLLGTSREQQWTTADDDVNTPSVSADSDVNRPLVTADEDENRPLVSNNRTYGAVTSNVDVNTPLVTHS